MKRDPFHYSTRKQIAFRKQRALFKKLTTEAARYDFLAKAEWWPLQLWLVKQSKGLRWYPTAVGMPMLEDGHADGFDTPEAAYARALQLKAEYEQLARTTPETALADALPT